MKTVKDILKDPGHTIWSVSPRTTAYEALEVMADKDIGALLVFEKEQLVGVFSERDYARKVILQGKASKDTPVSELMSRQVFYVKPENTLNECMALMTAKHIRHLPVFDNNRVMGIITMRDVVKAIVSEQEITIKAFEELMSYVRIDGF
ncbi:MAG: CBS domain-containing protein [Dissulfurispiraceae bacterium]